MRSNLKKLEEAERRLDENQRRIDEWQEYQTKVKIPCANVDSLGARNPCLELDNNDKENAQYWRDEFSKCDKARRDHFHKKKGSRLEDEGHRHHRNIIREKLWDCEGVLRGWIQWDPGFQRISMDASQKKKRNTKRKRRSTRRRSRKRTRSVKSRRY